MVVEVGGNTTSVEFAFVRTLPCAFVFVCVGMLVREMRCKAVTEGEIKLLCFPGATRHAVAGHVCGHVDVCVGGYSNIKVRLFT